MSKKTKPLSADEVRALRKKCGLNQSEFWSKLGVTQSGGSRYESGRNIPKPVQLLIKIAYGTDAQAAAAVDELRATPKEA